MQAAAAGVRARVRACGHAPARGCVHQLLGLDEKGRRYPVDDDGAGGCIKVEKNSLREERFCIVLKNQC